MGSAPGGQCLDGPTQGPPTAGRCRSGPAWTLAKVVTGQGPARVAAPRVWRSVGAHGPALCCPPAAALGTAGRRDGGGGAHLPPKVPHPLGKLPQPLPLRWSLRPGPGGTSLQPRPPLCFLQAWPDPMLPRPFHGLQLAPLQQGGSSGMKPVPHTQLLDTSR